MTSFDVSSPIKPSFGNRVIQGTVWGQAGKILESALTLGFAILVIRRLGPADYGRYGLISSAVVITMTLSALGTNEVLGSKVPALLAQGKEHSARRLTLRVVSVRLIAMLVGLAILLILRHQMAAWFRTPAFKESALWIALLALLLNIAELASGFLTTLLETRFVTCVRALGLGLSISAAMALFRFKGVSVQAALMATAMCSAVIIILTVRRGLAIISRWRTGPNAAPHFAKYALTVWAGNLTNVGLSLYSSVFLLGILVTDISQVGFYNAAVLPIGRLWTVMAAGMGTVMLPTLAEIGARHGAPGLARAWRAYVNVFVLVLLPTYGFVLVYATPLARFFFGEAYLPVSGLMRVYLALVLPGTFFVGTATINLFYATRRQGLVLLTSTIGGLLDIALLLLLIPKLNALGAILADGLSGLATSLLLFVLLKHRLPMLSYPIGFVLKIAGATFGAFTTAYWLVPPRSPVTAAISMMLGAILFISLSRALKPLIHEDLPLKQFGPRLGQIAQWFGAPCGTYPV